MIGSMSINFVLKPEIKILELLAAFFKLGIQLIL